MELNTMTIGLLAFGGVGCIVLGYFLSRILKGGDLKKTEAELASLKEMAMREADAIKKEAELQAKDMLLKIRQEFESETKERRDEISKQEKRIDQKEENLEKRLNLLEQKEKHIEDRGLSIQEKEENIKKMEEELIKIVEEEKQQLHKISTLTREEAKQMLFNKLDEELVEEKAQRIRQTEEDIKLSADKKARDIIATAIQRCASDHTAETTISVVNLPSDEMKGRIIGREGRNIRALEQATGVDVIIDDTPEAVTISGFDMMRRQVAKMALESLIADGRIHPGRIEEVVDKAKKELEQTVREEGEKAAFELGIHSMHPELLKLVGKLKFRTSFGQNVLQHTIEVAKLMAVMADMLGLDVKIAKRAGILHDIGKIVPAEQEEGTHAIVGARLARKFGEKDIVAAAVESHHGEVEISSVYGVLVCVADAISAARPGARAESLETYVKRLQSLETIANSYKGVEKAFALQAGREIRVMVDPGKLNDDEAIVLARDVRKQIEAEMEYPGHIKVLVVRETRAVEYAK